MRFLIVTEEKPTLTLEQYQFFHLCLLFSSASIYVVSHLKQSQSLLPSLFLPSFLPLHHSPHSFRLTSYFFFPSSKFPPLPFLPNHHLSPGLLCCLPTLLETRFEALKSISHKAAKECNIFNRKLDHTTKSPTLITLLWFPIVFRIKAELLMNIYKALWDLVLA